MSRFLLGSAVLAAVTLTVGAAAGSGPHGNPPGGPYQPPLAQLNLVEPFDPPAQPWQSGHRGVDLAATQADPVYAAADGIVVFAGRVVDRGVVAIDHGGIRTTYEPVNAAVEQGATVARGALIGHLGAGAHCSARCLHWGAVLAGEYVDPLTLLRGYSPVLKPPFL